MGRAVIEQFPSLEGIASGGPNCRTGHSPQLRGTGIIVALPFALYTQQALERREIGQEET